MDPDRPVVRWTLIVMWLLITPLLYAPVLALFVSPLLVATFFAGVVWTEQDFISVRHQTEQIRTGRRAVRLQLGAACVLAGSAVWLAAADSMGRNGHVHGMSKNVVPVALAVILVSALAAMRHPTPRRLAVVSFAILALGPLLAAVRVFAVPIFGDDDFRIVAPWVLTGYSIIVLAIAAIGINVGIVARRHGYGDEIPPPPPVATLR